MKKTIHPILVRLHSPDVLDIDTYIPEAPQHFGILVQAMFRPDDQTEGEESFDIIVCTPSWLAEEVKLAGIVSGRHHLIVSEFDIDALRLYMKDYAMNCAGNTWNEVAAKLSRLGNWEFEDYVPHASE